jgi:hypothetical protein
VRILPISANHKASIRGADPWHALRRETVTKLEAKQVKQTQHNKTAINADVKHPRLSHQINSKNYFLSKAEA